MADLERISSIPALPVVRGDVIHGRYLVGNVIGEGGMGVVFEATHLGLEAPVALKVIRSDLMQDEEFVLRFVNEARAAALLKGEHVARVHDVGKLETGEPYLVMERLEGISLEDFLETNGPLEPSHAAGLVLEVCEGLSEAHALALVHRDIKPANVFLSRRPDGRTLVKILDFGIAKRLVSKAQRGLTNPARSLGSPWYMSPEQMMDPSRVDVRTDVWSLGVLLFELLTGDHPFDGEEVPEVCVQVMHAAPPSLSIYRDDLEPALDALVLRCLEKDPDRRFQSVDALADRLLEFSSPPRSFVTATAMAVPRSWRRARPSRPNLGSLEPLADKLGLRPSPWSGALRAAGVLGVVGVTTWGGLTVWPHVSVPDVSWPDLGRLELPGDPVLSPGPAAAPLASDSRELALPAVPPQGALGAMPVSASLEPVSSEPALTPSEIRQRTMRYENWLRAQGLLRIEDSQAETTNPY